MFILLKFIIFIIIIVEEEVTINMRNIFILFLNFIAIKLTFMKFLLINFDLNKDFHFLKFNKVMNIK